MLMGIASVMQVTTDLIVTRIVHTSAAAVTRMELAFSVQI